MTLPRVLAFLWLVGIVSGQSPLPPPADVERNLETLRELAPALRSAEADLEELRKELAEAATEDAKAELAERVDARRERVRQLRANYRIVASGVEDAAYQGAVEPSAGLDAELKELLKPLVDGMREATSKPRQMDELRN